MANSETTTATGTPSILANTNAELRTKKKIKKISTRPKSIKGQHSPLTLCITHGLVGGAEKEVLQIARGFVGHGRTSKTGHVLYIDRCQPLHELMTKQTVAELDRFLTDNHFYDREDIDEVNKLVMEAWDNKLQDSTIYDLKQSIKGIEIQKTKSLFELISHEQGATLYKSFYDLVDNQEQIEIIIKLTINHDKAVVYLGSRHADKEAYSGKSELLRRIYRELKKADKEFGYFRPIDFYSFKIR